MNYFVKQFASFIGFILLAGWCFGQQVKEPNPIPTDWERPYTPFRIVGNLYYVGTYDLACYLITTPQGHVLINTGVASSAKQIEHNIRSLGFKMSDLKVLLTTQAHYDHLGAMAQIKKITSALLMANEADKPAIEDGGKSDYAFGGDVATFQPVKVGRILKDGDSVRCGNQTIQMLHHPGHTKGSCSFLFSVKDGSKTYRVLIANMPSIVIEGKLDSVAGYSSISKDYAYTFDAMKSLTFDIWLASHASQFKLHSKRKPGDEYNPAAFVDRAGYDALLSDLQLEYNQRK